jgi:hypothetical protein
VQITRSPNPFQNHFTDETCTAKTSQRVKNLLDAVADELEFKKKYQTSFVMLAPNTVEGKHVGIGQTKDFFFSPVNRLSSGAATRSRKKSTTTTGCS